MKWVPDDTSRFDWRPFYDSDELDAECERIVSSYLAARYGAVRFPISTDDLTVMVERDTSDLDLYADLSAQASDVEGMTDFFYRRKPAVRISRDLSLQPDSDRRLRTTLSHEYGHVRFHDFLWHTATASRVAATAPPANLARQRRKIMSLRSKLFPERDPGEPGPVADRLARTPRPARYPPGPRCRGTRLFDPPDSDWMEWQACYASAALLMPATRVRAIARKAGKGPGLIAAVAQAFDVSLEAAGRRLVQTGLLS